MGGGRVCWGLQPSATATAICRCSHQRYSHHSCSYCCRCSHQSYSHQCCSYGCCYSHQRYSHQCCSYSHRTAITAAAIAPLRLVSISIIALSLHPPRPLTPVLSSLPHPPTPAPPQVWSESSPSPSSSSSGLSRQLCLYCVQPCEVGLFAVEPVWRCVWCHCLAHVQCFVDRHPQVGAGGGAGAGQGLGYVCGGGGGGR